MAQSTAQADAVQCNNIFSEHEALLDFLDLGFEVSKEPKTEIEIFIFCPCFLIKHTLSLPSPLRFQKVLQEKRIKKITQVKDFISRRTS
jgi:hypothetical protein